VIFAKLSNPIRQQKAAAINLTGKAVKFAKIPDLFILIGVMPVY